ncbi:tetratricopeptide repeat protein [Streptomyces bathyalis]|uniref:Tetratricopeptide repeat protein n=1 Tax=Streptomyces bathyalis TaxID=2710756 RepID=A0A7T1WT68_9ACTN|nr:tetratricopeptide repeat protein [Streptomyces bathyalis]QPP08274.1 tetratricopeptide repeat protein [Streptomyces bathyalis]
MTTTGRRAVSRHLLAGASFVVASLLGILEGLATNTLAWLGDSAWVAWPAVAVLLAAAFVIELRSSRGAPDAIAVPDELPRDVGDFTGREQELLKLRNLIRQGADTLLISAIDGTPGVGKSTLLVHLAHQIVGRYPDARLYANLRGADDQGPAEPHAVLEQFLHSLGEHRIPQHPDAAAARYRSLLAGKRALVLLDNASDDAQVRPLLPGSPTCTVVVTSRARLTGLEGARQLTLKVFSEAEATELLRRIVGPERADEDEASTAAVVAACGRLPLALRIAGARLASRPDWTMATLAGRLADERRRLEELTAGNLDVRASFMISYRELSDEERRLFRLAALARTADLPVGAAARAADLSEEEVKAPLDRLVELHLLEPAASSEGLQFHDLLRLFARERSEDEDTADVREGALGRVMEWYLSRVAVADRVGGSSISRDEPASPATSPSTTASRSADRGPSGASSWLEREQENVAALIDQAAGLPDPLRPYCWRLAFALVPYLELRGDLAAWSATARTAAVAADESGEVVPRALALAGLGRLDAALGDAEGAEERFEGAVRLLRGEGSAMGEGELPDERQRPLAQVLHGQAAARLRRGEHQAARSAAEQAHVIYQRLPSSTGIGPHEIACAATLGDIAAASGRFAQAEEYYDEALRKQREAPDAADRAAVLARLGEAHRSRGRYDAAGAAFDEAAALHRDRGDEAARADMLEQAGITHDAAGRHSDAVAAYTSSRDIHRSLGRHSQECRLSCNEALSLWHLGRRERAVEALRAGIRTARRLGAADVEADARLNLSEILLGQGDAQRAARSAQAAHDRYAELDDPAGRARALTSLARARGRQGDFSGALGALKSARTEAERAHDDRTKASVLMEMGLTHRDSGSGGSAGRKHLEEAARTATSLMIPEPALAGRALMHLGGAEARAGRIGEAVTHFRQACEEYRLSGDRELEAATQMYLGRVLREGRPRYGASGNAYGRAADVFQAMGDAQGEGRALAGAGAALALSGDAGAARENFSRALALLSGEDARAVQRLNDVLRSGRPLRTDELPW